MAEFDAKTVHKNDWGVIGGGVVVLVASLLTWFSVDTGVAIIDISRNGWGSGFLAWFGILCSIAAAAIVAARVAGVDLPKLAVGWRTIVLALSALAALCIVLKLLTGFHSWDRGIGLYLGVIGSLVQAFFAYMAFADSGERADIDRMRAERAEKATATAAATAAATPLAPPAPGAPVAPVAEAAHDHDHEGHDHEGHDHPHA